MNQDIIYSRSQIVSDIQNKKRDYIDDLFEEYKYKWGDYPSCSNFYFSAQLFLSYEKIVILLEDMVDTGDSLLTVWNRRRKHDGRFAKKWNQRDIGF